MITVEDVVAEDVLLDATLLDVEDAPRYSRTIASGSRTRRENRAREVRCQGTMNVGILISPPNRRMDTVSLDIQNDLQASERVVRQVLYLFTRKFRIQKSE